MAHHGRHPVVGAQTSIIHGTCRGLRVTCGSAPAAHPTVQIHGHRDVSAGKRPSGSAGGHFTGKSSGEGVHPASGDHHTLPIAGATWDGHGCGGEGTSPFHPAYGGVASLEAPTKLQFRAMDTTATIQRGAAAPKAEARTSNALGGGPQQRERCPGKGGAKRATRAYASNFYAGPVLPEGTRRGSSS